MTARTPTNTTSEKAPKTIALLNEKMEAKLEEVNLQITKSGDDVVQRLMELFDKRFGELERNLIQKLNQHIKEEVEKQTQPMLKQLNAACKRIEELEGTIKKKHEDEEIQQRANNITISGIPSSTTENLRELTKAVFSSLGFEQPLAHTARRFHSHDPTKSMILMQFYSPNDKATFLNAYFKAAPRLTLQSITGNHAHTTRIYINHDLNKQQYDIHKLAMKCKREGRLSGVKVLQGRIAVFKPNINKPFYIETTDRLLNLIA